MGDALFLNKVWTESEFVNGIHIGAVCTRKPEILLESARSKVNLITEEYDEFLCNVDAVYVRSLPKYHHYHIKRALEAGKHVLCESSLTINREQGEELFDIARGRRLILMEAIKTAYATAYERLLLLLKSGVIGDIISVDTVRTSIRNDDAGTEWDSIYEWGPTALLPVFQILGTKCKSFSIYTHLDKRGRGSFTKIDFTYKNSIGSIKVGDGVKSEGEFIVSGTEGYIYVPAPWWKTDYFEVRYEDQTKNRRYYYQLDGEGIRYEIVAFLKAIDKGIGFSKIDREITLMISEIMYRYERRENMVMF